MVICCYKLSSLIFTFWGYYFIDVILKKEEEEGRKGGRKKESNVDGKKMQK